MATVIVRNLPEETHRALKVRAVMHGRSTEAEIRDILEKAAKPEGRIKLGSLLAEIGREAGLTDDEYSVLEQVRDRSPAEPIRFDR